MGIRDCLLTGPRTGRHRRKSYRAGPRLPPDRGETGARRNIPAGFCDRGRAVFVGDGEIQRIQRNVYEPARRNEFKNISVDAAVCADL